LFLKKAAKRRTLSIFLRYSHGIPCHGVGKGLSLSTFACGHVPIPYPGVGMLWSLIILNKRATFDHVADVVKKDLKKSKNGTLVLPIMAIVQGWQLSEKTAVSFCSVRRVGSFNCFVFV
jgi:hypothetical protein